MVFRKNDIKQLTINDTFANLTPRTKENTTTFSEQPISGRFFSRFRECLYNHQVETGENLLTGEMKHLTEVYQDFLSLNANIRRMDSMMIVTSVKRMSKLEIIYTVVGNDVVHLHRLGADDLIPKGLEHYLEPEYAPSLRNSKKTGITQKHCSWMMKGRLSGRLFKSFWIAQKARRLEGKSLITNEKG